MSRSDETIWLEVLEKLERAFATSFDGWDPMRQIPTRSASLDTFRAELDESVALAILARGIPVVRVMENNACRLLLPIPLAPRRTILAIASFTAVPPAWIDRMAEVFLSAHKNEYRCRELNDQMNAALSQITTDFEQQTFLRFLAEQIEICELNRTIESAMQAVLPRLQRVISARSLIFIPTSASTEGTESSGWLCYGKGGIDRRDCLHLLNHYQNEIERGTLVRNRGFSATEEDLPPAVRNLMAIRVAKDSLNLGWLMAFDRSAGFIAENEIDSGFGTTESGLLEVAAYMLATHGRNLELFQETEALTIDVVRTLVSAIEARDSYTRGHSERVALLARRLAEEIGLPSEHCQQIYVAGLLHDIGKIGVSDEILRKPGQLTREEFAEIQRHPDIGYAILLKLRKMAYLLPGVLSHHERIDGAGYPQGLAGDAIPLQARVLAVADSWDAMTSARPYRNALDVHKAAEILQQGKGKQWDLSIVDAFLGVLNEMIAICEDHAAKNEGYEDFSNIVASLPSRMRSFAVGPAVAGSNS